jgi:structural toxin protein (hemagglutinin/hemolysin) RtxA
MVKLSFYVPETHLESVKAAVFAAGAGQQGQYSQCAWQTLGQGQFCPSEQSKPFLGRPGQLTQVPEYRVEMLCPRSAVPAVAAALRKAHPYEEPAFDFTPILLDGREV